MTPSLRVTETPVCRLSSSECTLLTLLQKANKGTTRHPQRNRTAAEANGAFSFWQERSGSEAFKPGEPVLVGSQDSYV